MRLWKRTENKEANWSKEQWKQHLLGEAYSENERLEIQAMFAREEASPLSAPQHR